MPPLLLRPAYTEIEWWIVKGETYDIHVPVLDTNGVQLPAAAGWTAKAQVRRSEHENVLHEWSTANSNIEVTTTGALVVVLKVIGAATSLWEWTDALTSVEAYEPTTAKPHVIAQGPIHALPEITK
jgi:hypothetical protein